MIDPETVRLFIKLINISPRATLMKDTFEELRILFETDMSAAEDKVKQILEEYIQTLEPERQQRARAYNWRVQQELRNFKDPVARMNKMVEMFWKGVQEFQNALEGKTILHNQQGQPVATFPSKPPKVD